MGVSKHGERSGPEREVWERWGISPAEVGGGSYLARPGGGCGGVPWGVQERLQHPCTGARRGVTRELCLGTWGGLNQVSIRLWVSALVMISCVGLSPRGALS